MEDMETYDDGVLGRGHGGKRESRDGSDEAHRGQSGGRKKKWTRPSGEGAANIRGRAGGMKRTGEGAAGRGDPSRFL